MSTVLLHAVRPTARALRWSPLLGVAALLLGVAALSRAAARPADMVLALGAAGLASVVVGALHDPAARLLQPLPVPAMHRRVLRLVIVGTPVLAVWWAIASVVDTAGSSGVGPLVALTSSGVAVAVWTPAGRAVLLGAALPVAWFVLDNAVGDAGVLADVAGWWRTDPWLVTAVAVLACVAGRQR